MNRIARLFLISIVLLVVCSLPVFASGVKDERSNSDGNNVTIKFWKAGTDVAVHEYWMALIKEYENETGIKIEYFEAPFGSEIDTKLNTAFASGTAPDLISHAIYSIASRARLGQYESIDRYVDSWSDKDDIYSSMYELGSYQGELYGLGYYPGPFVFMYRKDYMEEAGLDPNDPPETWEDLAEIAPLLTVKDGDQIIRAGFNLPVDNTRLFLSMAVQNGVVFSDNDGNPSWNTPEFVETLYFIKELSKTSAIQVTVTEDNKQPLFITGRAAISQVKPSHIAQMINSNPTLKDQIGVLRLANKKAATWAGCEFLFISSETELKDECWDFIEYVMDKDEMWKRYVEANVPTVRNSLKTQYLEADPLLNEAITIGTETGIGAAKVPWWGIFNKTVEIIMQEVIYGKKTPEEALTDNYALFEKEIENIK